MARGGGGTRVAARGDGLNDCVRIARAPCPRGTVRYRATQTCVAADDCAAMNCGPGGRGAFVAALGACECAGAPAHVDAVCDAECRRALPRLIRPADGGAPQLACDDADEAAMALRGSHRITPVTFSSGGAVHASYDVEEEDLVALGLVGSAARCAPSAAVAARRRRLADVNVWDNVVTSPLICVKVGEELLFKTASTSSATYPAYVADATDINESGDGVAFDEAAYAAAAVEGLAATPGSFSYAFPKQGVYVFGNAATTAASTDFAVVTVISVDAVCPVDGARIVPYTSSSASVAGVVVAGDFLTEPPWWLIGAIAGALFAAGGIFVLALGLVRFCKRRRLKAAVASKRYANPRSMNFEVQRPGEENLSKVVGDLKKHDDHVRRALEKQRRTNDEIASTMSSEMETLRELLASLLFVRKTPFAKVNALRTWVETALLQHATFRAGASLLSKVRCSFLFVCFSSSFSLLRSLFAHRIGRLLLSRRTWSARCATSAPHSGSPTKARKSSPSRRLRISSGRRCARSRTARRLRRRARRRSASSSARPRRSLSAACSPASRTPSRRASTSTRRAHYRSTASSRCRRSRS